MIVAVTGHRPDKLGGYASNSLRTRVVAALTLALGALKVQHPDLRLLTGMALGVDQWAAQVCLGLDIPYEAAVPFKGQESRWPEQSQSTYRSLVEQADKVHIVCEGEYRPYMMQKRNEFMVDRCQLLLAAWDGSDGGTANCVRYAWSVDRPVQRLEW